MQHYLKPNSARISHKIVDGEAVLIDLTNGLYFSLPSVAGFIWGMIDSGHGLDTIAAAVASRYNVAADVATNDVNALARVLLDEHLVVVGESGGDAEASNVEHEAVTEAYSAPEINKFDDMVDLFALDPPLPELAKLKPVD